MADAARVIGSIPVANVQALAETCNNNGDLPVPERYLAKDPSAEVVVAADDSSLAIPVIDLQKLLDPQSSEEECAKLGAACLDWGFFQLINHGVPDEVIANLSKDAVGFFKQPLEAKKECAQQVGGLEGYGQAFVVSEDQKLDWADMLYLIVQPRESRDMRFWPTRPASLRDSVDSYSMEAAKLAMCLLESMAKGVGVDPAVLRGAFQGMPQSLKVNYYPPCRQAADRVVGLSTHTDANVMTLLLQMNTDVKGLQVKKDGRWITVDAVNGTFIVNIGDMLEIMSNGKFTSVEHRAVVHPTKERFSVALFFHPFPNMMVAPLAEFTKGDKERYRSIGYDDFMKQYFAASLDGREHIEVLRTEQ